MLIHQPGLDEDRGIRRYSLAAIAFLTVVFTLNVYRAATQSITTDEAFSYLHYIGTERFSLLNEYSANVHFLHTLLVWCSVKLFGLSEMSMRIPSLMGCALYFAAVWKICYQRFGNHFACLAGAVLLAANPLIEDHMSVSRGYGLALAFFAWAVYEASQAVQADFSTPSPPQKHLFRLALFSALSAASNLTFSLPTGALMAIVTWMLWQKSTGVRLADFASQVLKNMVGPWLVLLFVLMVIPLSRVGPGTFYFGADSIAESLRSLLEMSGANNAVDRPIALWIGSALFAGFLGLFVSLLRRERQGRADSFGLLTLGTLVLTTLGLGAGHLLIGLAYPSSRTGLHLIFLTLLSVLLLCRWRMGAAVVVLLGIAMLSRIRLDRYQEWSWDRDNRQIAEAIVARHNDEPSTRVFTSPFLDQSLLFYKQMYGLNWLTASASPEWAPYDYAILWKNDLESLQTRHLRTVYTGPGAAIVLAVHQ